MPSLTILGRFGVTEDGVTVPVMSAASRRLLAFLALTPHAIGRTAVAGMMWPDASDHLASVSLRATLSRMGAPTRQLISSTPAKLAIAEGVTVDLRSSHAMALRLLPESSSLLVSDIAPEAVAALSQELLPDWYNDWVTEAAEDWRSLRLGGLEAQTRLLTGLGRLPEAGVAARATIAVDPLRETAQAALIRVHLAEGNQSEALRVFDRYCGLLYGSLGLAPTERLVGMVRHLTR